MATVLFQKPPYGGFPLLEAAAIQRLMPTPQANNQTTPRARMSARTFAALSLLAALAASGCGGADPEELRSAAQSLVPNESRVIERHEAACAQLSAPPSCVKLSFLTGQAPRGRRVELVRAVARAHDWDARGTTAFARETWLYFERDNYEATAVILNDSWRATCRDELKCSDSVTVIRR